MTDTPDLNQLTNLTATQKAAGTSLLGNQSTEDADYLKRYTDFINSQEGASAMAKRLGTELKLPTLQNNATMLQNTLTNLPTTYSKATTGFDVNANQLSRIIGQKSSELQPMVTTAQNSLEAARNNLNTQMGYEQTDQAKALLPYQTEKELLADRQAREISMFSETNQNELTALVTKINAGITLSEGEKARANSLAIAEKQYTDTKASMMTVSEGTSVFDPTTGKMVYKNAKTYAPGTSSGTWS